MFQLRVLNGTATWERGSGASYAVLWFDAMRSEWSLAPGPPTPTAPRAAFLHTSDVNSTLALASLGMSAGALYPQGVVDTTVVVDPVIRDRFGGVAPAWAIRSTVGMLPAGAQPWRTFESLAAHFVRSTGSGPTLQVISAPSIPSNTPTPSGTPTMTASPTSSQTPSNSPTSSQTPSNTGSATASMLTQSATATVSASGSLSLSASASPTPSKPLPSPRAGAAGAAPTAQTLVNATLQLMGLPEALANALLALPASTHEAIVATTLGRLLIPESHWFSVRSVMAYGVRATARALGAVHRQRDDAAAWWVAMQAIPAAAAAGRALQGSDCPVVWADAGCNSRCCGCTMCQSCSGSGCPSSRICSGCPPPSGTSTPGPTPSGTPSPSQTPSQTPSTTSTPSPSPTVLPFTSVGLRFELVVAAVAGAVSDGSLGGTGACASTNATSLAAPAVWRRLVAATMGSPDLATALWAQYVAALGDAAGAPSATPPTLAPMDESTVAVTVQAAPPQSNSAAPAGQLCLVAGRCAPALYVYLVLAGVGLAAILSLACCCYCCCRRKPAAPVSAEGGKESDDAGGGFGGGGRGDFMVVNPSTRNVMLPRSALPQASSYPPVFSG